MIGYASRTGTRRNLAMLKARGWRLMVSATDRWNTQGFPYAIDNGAWTAYQAGSAWDADLFQRCLERLGHGCDWVVLPDIVQGGLRSLDRSAQWIDRVPFSSLLAVQDGMTVEDVRPYLDRVYGLFIGGSSEWKERTAHEWVRVAHAMGRYTHMGRVNSKRRIRIAALAGCDSFDGTGPTKYARDIPWLDLQRRQRVLWCSGKESC